MFLAVLKLIASISNNDGEVFAHDITRPAIATRADSRNVTPAMITSTALTCPDGKLDEVEQRNGRSFVTDVAGRVQPISARQHGRQALQGGHILPGKLPAIDEHPHGSGACIRAQYAAEF